METKFVIEVPSYWRYGNAGLACWVRFIANNYVREAAQGRVVYDLSHRNNYLVPKGEILVVGLFSLAGTGRKSANVKAEIGDQNAGSGCDSSYFRQVLRR